MQIFVGLGNPGAKYAQNRHNIGFMALDRIAEDHGFGPWKARFQGQVSEGRLGGEKVVLLKPETFMNLSGQSVGEAIRFYKLEPGDVTVFHDELDLAPSKCRVKMGGGHAGHNGLRSIHAHIGEAYQRVRLGIGHPGRKELVAAYVLHDFHKADQDWLDDLLRGLSDGAPHLAEGDTGKFQNAVALRVAPPRSSTSGEAASGKSGPKSGPKSGAKPGQKPPYRGGQKRKVPLPGPVTGKPGKASRDAEAEAAQSEAMETPEAPDERSPLQRLADKFRH